MSLPAFPNPSNLTREDVVNQIISSIAMEELSLSHILNAEGEKLQYVLGTLTGSSGLNPDLDQLLQMNESVRQTLSSAMQAQMFLHNKMSAALNTSTMQGPTGSTGPSGPAVSVADFDPAQADTYVQGQLIRYNGTMYISGVDQPQGEPGVSADYTTFFADNTVLFNTEAVVNGVAGAAAPVTYGGAMRFVTNTPENVSLSVAPGSAEITVDVRMVVPEFDSAKANYELGQLVRSNGQVYAVLNAPPMGAPGASADFAALGAGAAAS